MARDTKRGIDNKIDELRDETDYDGVDSWRRFISGDLDPHDPNHAQWITAGKDMTIDEGREWLRWHESLDDETLDLVKEASVAGATIPRGATADEIREIKRAAEEHDERHDDATVRSIALAAEERAKEIGAGYYGDESDETEVDR